VIRAFAAALLVLLASALPARAEEKKSVPLHMLCLGDSYTIGEGVPESERWPSQLAAELRKRGLDVAEPQVIARTGWTTANLQDAIAAAELKPPYDLVTLLIGVNDQFQRKAHADYSERLDALVKRAIELAGGKKERVVVVSIPDYSVTPFGQKYDPARTTKELEQWNATGREAAKKAGLAYVDITPGSKRAATEKTLLAPDELHPSAVMYAEWVKAIVPVVEPVLKPQSKS
jgi:lysophospholipase L1-like esterase